MNSLLEGVLSTLRRERDADTHRRCPVCHRHVDPREAHTTLRAGTPVHRQCAVYRLRRETRRRN